MSSPRVDVGRGVMSLLSHASDGATEAAWLRRDVDVMSCWRRCSQGTVGHGIVDDHANVTSGLICILILGKRENKKNVNIFFPDLHTAGDDPY
jgi:hypothetical protein